MLQKYSVEMSFAFEELFDEFDTRQTNALHYNVNFLQ